MKLKKLKINKGNISQKKRYFFKQKELKLQFGDFGFFFEKENRLELIYLIFLRKMIKKIKFPIGLKIMPHIFIKKVWFFLKKNFPLTKKSKNSRMGKGKGKFARYCIRIPQNFIFFEFKGYNRSQLTLISKKFNRKNNLHVKCLYDFQLNFALLSKHRYSSTYVTYYTTF